MLLKLLLFSHLIALALANPFHKYPYVFLLDVGNEELQNTTSEQIRLSAPGGSIALRYPGIQGGDTIVHVRVSGIDFGTDLKSNIVEGGPGYNYVVISFIGNPGVPYDAVVTVQTLAIDKFPLKNTIAPDMSGVGNGYQRTEDTENKPNNDLKAKSDNSLESNDLNESDPQPSVNLYSLVQNLLEKENTNWNKVENNSDEEKEDGANQKDDYEKSPKDDFKEQVQQESSKAERYVSNGYVADESYDGEEPIIVVDNNLYKQYNALKSHFNGNVKILPQEAFNDLQNEEDTDELENTDLTDEDPDELDQMFNDEEVHNNADKLKDSNNNYFESDESSAAIS